MHAVLIDAEYDFARFPFAAEVPPFMLTVVGRSLLERVVEWVRELDPVRIVLVTRRTREEYPAAFQALADLGVEAVPDLAAPLRAAVTSRHQLLMMRANLNSLPNARRLLEQHEASGEGPSHARGTLRTGPGVYTYGTPVLFLMNPTVTRSLVEADLGQPFRAIPRVLRSQGLVSHALDPDRPIVEVNCNYALYDANLGALAEYRYELYGRGLRPLKPNLWAGEDVDVGEVQFDPRGGLVVVGARTKFVGRTALRGPAVIGADVVVGRGTCIHQGLVLDGTGLPPESFVAHAVVSPLLHEPVPPG